MVAQCAGPVVETAAACPWIADAAEVVVLAVDDGRADVDAAIESAVPALEAVGVVPCLRVFHVYMTTGAILDEVAAQSSDLVVLGTRGLTGLPRLRLGSTAGAVARVVSCAVLVASAADSDTVPRA